MTGKIDVGMLQSLNRKGVVKDLVTEYGQVIVDECHHISAFSFEQVLKKVRASYICGLTATPFRKDGHHPIIMMQCGPVRFCITAKQQATMSSFEHIVCPRYTKFDINGLGFKAGIQDIYSSIIADKERNDFIFNDLVEALENRRSPLFLTERTEHVDKFARRLRKFAKNVLVFKGGMGKKQREELRNRLRELPDNEERVLISTGRYIGEGFDDARLDTLFLAMPISWRGTLQQYVGRLHRAHDNKKIVKVYDYVDGFIPVLKKMFHRRVKGYRAIGYRIEETSELEEKARAM